MAVVAVARLLRKKKKKSPRIVLVVMMVMVTTTMNKHGVHLLLLPLMLLLRIKMAHKETYTDVALALAPAVVGVANLSSLFRSSSPRRRHNNYA